MTKRHCKGPDGKFNIKGKKYEMLIGSRAQVHHHTAYKTTGGLKHCDLKKNKHGKIVSKRKSSKGAMMLKRLTSKGYNTQKGKFGWVKGKGSSCKKGSKRRGRSSKRRGRGSKRR